MLPENINIASKTVSTMIPVLIIGAFSFFFILWCESKKDGFNSDKFFDLTFITIFFSGVVVYFLYKLLEWLKIFRPASNLLYFNQEMLLTITSFLLLIPPILFTSKRFKWSVFRILDIYSMGFSMLLMIISLGYFLITNQREYSFLFFTLFVLYISVLRFRGYKYISGMVFSIFLIFISISLISYLRKGGYLLFAPILVTISVLNLYLRGKKTMTKSILPQNLISHLRDKLVSKDKRLSLEQKSLIENDPYLQPDRATDNAETLDDVMEDTGKNITDARLNIVRGLRIQVRKALAAIKLGKYGKCEVCGKPIDKARLMVYPEATTCIDCATDTSQMAEVHEDELLEKNL